MTFNKDGTYEVELTGCVYADEGSLLADDFLSKFIVFVEENGWSYGGGSRQIIDGNLNPLEPIEDN